MPLPELIAVLAGAALLVAARRSRVAAQRQRRRVLRQAFRSPDPATRRAAIHVAGDEGLSRSADVFLDLVDREMDPSVLLLLAQVVVRNQWEHARDPTYLRLRLWAHRYLDTVSPREETPVTGSRPREYQGPSVGEVVNLLMQSNGRSRPPPRRRQRRRPRQWA